VRLAAVGAATHIHVVCPCWNESNERIDITILEPASTSGHCALAVTTDASSIKRGKLATTLKNEARG
jgi:hypothetical protein